MLGFGVTLTDCDADGRLDLFQANGHVLDRARLGVPFAMRPTLLRNAGGKFADASTTGGPWFSRPILGRGLAVGDLDRDGRPDVVVNAIDAPAAVLHNETAGASLSPWTRDRHGLPAVGRMSAPRSTAGSSSARSSRAAATWPPPTGESTSAWPTPRARAGGSLLALGAG